MKLRTLICLMLILAGCGTIQTQGPLDPHWIPLRSGVQESLRGICVVNRDVVWVTGSNGTCLRTLDSGETWVKMIVPGAAQLDFRDVFAFDQHRAIVMTAGTPANIYRTEDGGKTWTQTLSSNDPSVFFDALAFWNRRDGLVFSDPVDGGLLVLLTRDGGLTFSAITQTEALKTFEGEAGFAASGTCLAVEGEKNAWIATGGSRARVFRTQDMGESWQVFKTPILCGEPSQGIFSILFMGPKNGVIVGGDYKNPKSRERNAAHTQDGGETWVLVEKAPPNGYRSCVDHLLIREKPVLIAVGPSGSDLSWDLGRTWAPMGRTGFHCMDLKEDYGFAAGGNGRIARFSMGFEE